MGGGRSDYSYLADGSQNEGAAQQLIEVTEDNDNFRAKRYVAKYTINLQLPTALLSTGSVVGKLWIVPLASSIFWKAIVIKGAIAYAQMGDANASIPHRSLFMRPMLCRGSDCRHH